jgi:hypothetical protein
MRQREPLGDRAAIATGQSIPARSARRRARAREPLDARLVLRGGRSPGGRRSEAGRRRLRSSAITCSSAARAARRRPSCAGPAPRTRRRLLWSRSEESPATTPLFAVPGDGAREAFLERRARPPTGQAFHLVRSSRCAGRPVPSRPSRARAGPRACRRVEHRVGDVVDGDVDAGRDVEASPATFSSGAAITPRSPRRRRRRRASRGSRGRRRGSSAARPAAPA